MTPPTNESLAIRVGKLETWQATQEALGAERLKHFDEKFENVDKQLSDLKESLDDVNAKIGRVAWIILSAVGTAAVAAVLGNFTNVAG